MRLGIYSSNIARRFSQRTRAGFLILFLCVALVDIYAQPVSVNLLSQQGVPIRGATIVFRPAGTTAGKAYKAIEQPGGHYELLLPRSLGTVSYGVEISAGVSILPD